MKVKVGDKITMLSYTDYDESVVYTVLDIDDTSVKVKHPEIAGHFIFSKDRINKVVSEALCK